MPDRLWHVAIREPGGRTVQVDTPRAGPSWTGKPTLSATPWVRRERGRRASQATGGQ